MKKILHISQTNILKDSRIQKEFTTLLNAGYNVYGYGISSEKNFVKNTEKFSDKIKILVVDYKLIKYCPKFLQHIITLIALIIKVIPYSIRIKPDVVHCHDTLAVPIGVIIKILTCAKVIYDAHELESDRNGLSPFLGRLTLKVERILWPFIDALIVVSPSIEKWYSDNIGFKITTVILNSPVFVKVENPIPHYLRKKYAIPTSEAIFVYVGILGNGRGIDLILSAFTSGKINSHIVFLGYGDLSDYLKTISKNIPNVHVHDPVPHDQVVPVIQSANYGLCLIQNVSLSDYYCLPNKLFEYCFAGIPVLASNFPDIKKIVNEYNLGEVCELNEEAVLESIKRIENNPLPREFENLHPLSWQEQETKLLSLYEKLF